MFQVQVCAPVRPQPVRVGLLPQGDHGLQPVHRPPPPGLLGSQSGKHGMPRYLVHTFVITLIVVLTVTSTLYRVAHLVVVF